MLNLLSEKFDITVNTKGYRVLPSYLRLLQGDGINYETIAKVCMSNTIVMSNMYE